MPPIINQALDLVSNLCHGREEAVFCLRCTGVWAGAALALPMLILANRRFSLLMWLFLLAALFQMPYLGYGEIQLPEWVKCLSGQVFAMSAICFISFNTLGRVLKKRSEKSAGSLFIFFAAIGTGALQALIHLTSEKAHQVLDLLCLTGLAACLLLSLWMVIGFFIAMRRKTAPTAE